MAKPYYSEVTSLVRSHCPEVTRPVEGMKFCFCGGMYVRSACERDDCPRARLGHGSWHAALPGLQELWSQNQLVDLYPHLSLSALQDHVERIGRERQEKRELHQGRHEKVRARGHRRERKGPPERERQCEQPEEQRRARRQPRQPGFPPPGVASSSNAQLPVQEVKIEPIAIASDVQLVQMMQSELDVDVDSDDADGDGKGYASEITVLDSDESGASIFGLRSALHEMVALLRGWGA